MKRLQRANQKLPAFHSDRIFMVFFTRPRNWSCSE